MSFPSRKSPEASHTPAGITSLIKTAAVSLENRGLTNERAAVYLLLDHSGSMSRHYSNGDVQRLAEQALGLSVNLDDDGTVPLVYFGSRADQLEDIHLDNYAGVIDRTHPSVAWGSTNYAAAIRYVVSAHMAQAPTTPAFVIFQTDGDPDSQYAAEKALRDASRFPLHFAFVGFGNRISFLQKLDDLTGRAVDNATFFHAPDPRSIHDAALYDGITAEFGPWLRAARAQHIL